MGMVGRFASGLVALPLRLALRTLHRAWTGSSAILDLTIQAVPDLRERHRFLHRLHRVAQESGVEALLLRLRAPIGGWAAMHDLREVVQELRRAGKQVYALLEAPGNGLVWLASACDRVFIVPTGELGLIGVGVELTFFGDALRRMGVKPDFEAAGAYKSFGEPWTRAFPSAENQEAMQALVEGLHEQLVEGIARGRSRAVSDIAELLERAPLSAKEALDEGLVDQLAYIDQVEDWLDERHPDGALQSFNGWAMRDQMLESLEGWGGPDTAVSVVHLQGPVVVDDNARGPTIAARKVLPLLKALREDDNVGAVVLHVDSPGGSALASDMIWREVDELKRRKPVVASFEDTAASGGYYLAAPASEIVVRPGTLTGSIGVFGGKLVMSEGLRKVGVHSREVLGAPNANLFTAAKPFSEPQRARFRASLQRFYDGFVDRVAKGRGASEADIEPHCRGRVWTGTAAKNRNLADREGNLDVAVDRARRLAGLSEGQFVRRNHATYSMPLGARMLQSMARRVAPGATEPGAWFWRLLRQLIPAASSPLLEMAASHPGEPLAMLPYDITLERR